jgi:hypothetical protein
MITAAQCRSAASVPANVIDSFELERQRTDAATLGALQRAFEAIHVNDGPADTDNGGDRYSDHRTT